MSGLQVFIQQLLNGLVIGSGYILIATGLTMVFGILEIINMAQGEIFMLGAFFTYALINAFGMSYFTAIPIAVVLGLLLGMVLYKTTIKRLIGKDHLTTLLVTFAVSTLLMNLAQLIWGSTPRNIPSPLQTAVEVGGIYLTWQKIVMVFAVVVIIAVMALVINKTMAGKMIRACSENKFAAGIVGINVNKVYLGTFILGCSLGALAGPLLGPITYVFPSMGQAIGIKAFVIVIVGGLGNIPGAIAGGVVLGIAESLGAGYISAEWKDLIGYLVLIIVLMIKPKGLLSKEEM